MSRFWQSQPRWTVAACARTCAQAEADVARHMRMECMMRLSMCCLGWASREAEQPSPRRHESQCLGTHSAIFPGEYSCLACLPARLPACVLACLLARTPSRIFICRSISLPGGCMDGWVSRQGTRRGSCSTGGRPSTCRESSPCPPRA